MDALTLPDCLENLQGLVQRQLQGRLRHLALERHGDGLVLRGQAATYYVKQMAQHIVMKASAEPILANEIEVV